VYPRRDRHATGLGGLAFREHAIQPDLDPPLPLLQVQESVNLQEFAGRCPIPIGERAQPAEFARLPRSTASPGRDSEHVYTSLSLLGIKRHPHRPRPHVDGDGGTEFDDE
jgi:hypothetical protein